MNKVDKIHTILKENKRLSDNLTHIFVRAQKCVTYRCFLASEKVGKGRLRKNFEPRVVQLD